MMVEGLISANLLLCERLLTEQDGVQSAIRIVDIFRIQPNPNVPPEHTRVTFYLHFTAKFEEGHKGSHDIELRIRSPKGEERAVGRSTSPASSDYPAPSGVSVVANIGAIPTLMGTYLALVRIDGEEVARAPFTLIEDSVSSTPGRDEESEPQ